MPEAPTEEHYQSKPLHEHLGLTEEQAEEALLQIRDSWNMNTPPNAFSTEFQFFADTVKRMGLDPLSVFVGAHLSDMRWSLRYRPETTEEPDEPAPF